MKKIIAYFRSNPLNLLLLVLPFVILAELLDWGALPVFILSSLTLIPLAGYIGVATEVLATYIGPRLGGLLNATLGNAAELIITIFAIRAGLLELVKASITGSILGNIMLVLGMSMVFGGARHGTQKFNRRQASNNAILLILAVLALLIPSLLSASIGPENSPKVEFLSLGTAGVMIVLYALGIYYGFRLQDGPLGGQVVVETAQVDQPAASDLAHKHPAWSVRKAALILALSTAGVAYMSELLVGAVEPVVTGLGISEFFLGIILIPIIGNVAEHLVAVRVAYQNQMDLSVEIAISSSLQIALFVAPVLVFISLVMGNPLHLVFNSFELLALIAGVVVAAMASADGESNWLEGAELLGLYLILGLAFFLLPT